MEITELTFVLPACSDAVSGGNIYNAALARALSAVIPVRMSSVARWQEQMARGKRGVYLVDSLNLADATSPLAQRQPGQHCLLVVHHLPSWEPGIDLQGEAVVVEQQLLPLFDAWLTTSAFTTELLVSRGLERGRLLTVPPGLSAVDRPTRSYSPPLSALIVGNLIPRKAVLELLTALQGQIRETDQFHLTSVGRDDLDPDYALACRSCVANSAALGKHVEFRGAVPHALIDDFYRAAALLLAPAKFETFGIALQEARAHGLVILAYDGGNARAHFTDAQKHLVFQSIPALAAEFLALSRDAERMRALFESAQRAEPNTEYTWPRAAAQFLEQLGRCAAAWH